MKRSDQHLTDVADVSSRARAPHASFHMIASISMGTRRYPAGLMLGSWISLGRSALSRTWRRAAVGERGQSDPELALSL